MGTNITGIPALLKTSNGCVCVQTARPSKSYQLVEEKLQGNDHGNIGKVKVYYVYKGNVRCMAFCFEMSGKAIFPVVTDGKDVRFEELPKQEFTKDTFKEKFLFQWGEEGSEGCRSLKSVAKPGMYLFVEHQMPRVTIKPVEIPFFKIKERAEEAQDETEEARMGMIPTNSKMKTCVVTLGNRDFNNRPSHRAATALSTKSKCCLKRKNKRMKPKAKCFSEVFTNKKDPDQSTSSAQYMCLRGKTWMLRKSESK